MSYADGLLANDETVVRREHQHWIFPFYIAGKWVAIAIGVTVIGFILSQWVFKSDGTGIIGGTIAFINTVVTFVTVIALAFAVIGFIYSVIQWQSQEYILTTVRVLHVHGVINKQSGDSSLENITDAQIRVPWLGRILGFGDLVVMTASEAGINNLRALRDPIGFKKAMMETKTDADDRPQHARGRRPPSAAAGGRGARSGTRPGARSRSGRRPRPPPSIPTRSRRPSPRSRRCATRGPSPPRSSTPRSRSCSTGSEGRSPAPPTLTERPITGNVGRRGVEQRQLVGLITRRSGVRIPSPQPTPLPPEPRDPTTPGFFFCQAAAP